MRFRPQLERLGDRLTPTTDPYLPTDPTNPPDPPPDWDTIDQGDAFYLALGLTDPWTDPWQPMDLPLSSTQSSGPAR